MSHRKLLDFLRDQDADYLLRQHEPYSSTEEATRITGIPPERAAKALLFQAAGQFALAVLPANARVHSGKLRRALSVKRLQMATPDQLREIMNCEPGTCHPIGRVAGVQTIVDPTLGNNETFSFSTGDPTHTITMPYAEYVRVAEPTIADILRDPTSASPTTP